MTDAERELGCTLLNEDDVCYKLCTFKRYVTLREIKIF
jgi:hypothetical protein